MDNSAKAKEFGLFEAMINLNKVLYSHNVAEKAGAFMPLPPDNISEMAYAAVCWLKQFNKRKYLFFTPEWAVIEKMATTDVDEVHVLVPRNLPSDTRERIRNNVPDNVYVSLVDETTKPQGDFIPANGILVVCGYKAGHHLMVMPDTYRLMEENFSTFFGRKAFLPYVTLESATYYPGWIEVNSNEFTDIWEVQSNVE